MSDPAGPEKNAGPGGDGGSRRYFADVLTFGWVLPAAIAAGAGLGWVLDRIFGLYPVLTAVLGVVGLAAGLRQIYRESVLLSRDGKGPGNGPG